MNRPIDNYMTVGEAAYRWGLSVETVRNRLKPSIKGNKEKIDRLVNKGLIRYSWDPDNKHGSWIISSAAMHYWYPQKKEINLRSGVEEKGFPVLAIE